MKLNILTSLAACMLMGCAATTGGYGPAPISEGRGRLVLDAGGIPQLNFYVTDQETDEEVHADTPRMSASSPTSYLTGTEVSNLVVDLEPGMYTVRINTDISDDVLIEDVEIRMGEERFVPVPVGRFAIRFTGSAQTNTQIPFIIMDYPMRSVLGKAMTSSAVKHFLVPAGRTYKVRIENSPTGQDEIIPVEVGFGGITQMQIGEPVQEEEDSGDTTTP
ncbi:MAG: hypothetical protein HN712_05440 [Gemmatimonadetes bacterium]|jgi:hypothetical protein|nr:hypothetical protein [Gemmatimonadota bacterium]MBT6144150.1 hypothetical protein [Gemmatimonadota bacterium]MBT7859732.1 hypothetical protein [Gemmatimonadota bacterium]